MLDSRRSLADHQLVSYQLGLDQVYASTIMSFLSSHSCHLLSPLPLCVSDIQMPKCMVLMMLIVVD
jgi:hypothetical protein